MYTRKSILTIALFITFTTGAMAQKKRIKTSIIKIETTISESREECFEYIVPIDLSHIFHRYKNLPGIDSTSNKARWYHPGQTRTVYFEDGTTAQETLLAVAEYTSFAYRIEGFTSSLRHLAREIHGNWQFSERVTGQTSIVWTYEIVPRSGVARWMFNAMAKGKLEVMLNKALEIIKSDLETGKPRTSPGA